MQDISQDTLNESAKLAQSARITLWEIDLTQSGGDRYFFCNEANEKGEAVTWQGRKYDVYPVDGCGFEMNGKGAAARPSLKVSNLYGMVTGMVEDLHSLVGATVIRRIVYARFLDAVNFQNGNQEADPEQESVSRWVIEQCSDLTAVSATFVLATPTETDGCVFPGELCWPIPVHGYTALTNAVIRDQLSQMNLITLPPIRQKMPAAAAPGDAPCVTIPETLAVSSPLINFHSKSS